MCGQVDTYAIKPKCNQVMNASKTAPKTGGRLEVCVAKGRTAKGTRGKRKRQGKTQTRNSNKLICTRNEGDGDVRVGYGAGLQQLELLVWLEAVGEGEE